MTLWADTLSKSFRALRGLLLKTTAYWLGSPYAHYGDEHTFSITLTS